MPNWIAKSPLAKCSFLTQYRHCTIDEVDDPQPGDDEDAEAGDDGGARSDCWGIRRR